MDTGLCFPAVDKWQSSLLMVISMQPLSYDIAAHPGLDVDQLRNLAERVTVD